MQKRTSVSPHPVTVSRTRGTLLLGCGNLADRTARLNASGAANRNAAMSLSNCGFPYCGCTVTLETATILPPESRRVLPTRNRTLDGETLKKVPKTLYVYFCHKLRYPPDDIVDKNTIEFPRGFQQGNQANGDQYFLYLSIKILFRSWSSNADLSDLRLQHTFLIQQRKLIDLVYLQ